MTRTRNVLRVVDRGVELGLARGRVEQLAAQLARERLERGDRLGRERGQQQPAGELRGTAGRR